MILIFSLFKLIIKIHKNVICNNLVVIKIRIKSLLKKYYSLFHFYLYY